MIFVADLTAADHKHRFTIDKDRKGVSKIWHKNGIYYLNEDIATVGEGWDSYVFLTCDHEKCDVYLSITKKVFYPNMIKEG